MRYTVRAVSLFHDAIYEPIPSMESEKDDAERKVNDDIIRSGGMSTLSRSLPSNAFYLQVLCEEYMPSSEGELLHFM